MSRKWMVLLGVVLVSSLWIACPKKKPATPAEDLTTKTTTVAPDATEVTAPDTPATGADEVEDWMSDDLAEMTRRLHEQGLIGDVFFDYDRAELKPEARERLAKNAQFLASQPGLMVTLEGHCDERGTNEYNLALGERRANAAREYLQSLGVAGTRVRTISYGEERPFCTESSEGCWSQNRRAHFVITSRANVG
jgi:peptidoglycan-associated lipoprotein